MLVVDAYHLFLASNGPPLIAHFYRKNSLGSSGYQLIVLIFLAIMLLVFLLVVIYSFEGSSGGGHETLCTSNACYTLHTDRVSFEKARLNCDESGGYLMTVRDRTDEEVLHSLLSQIQRRQERGLKFWIGLKLHRGDCVLPSKTLKGFKWTSGEEDSQYSNWQKEPVTTCTEERCVKIHYNSSGQNELKWTAGTCKTSLLYACKFYFQGMCKPLALLGPGQITYIAPFSKDPQRQEMQSFPHGTSAEIVCSPQQSDYSLCVGMDGSYGWTTPGPFCEAAKRSCAINNGGCGHVCHQDADEVQCFCREGYDLDEDGITCRVKDLCDVDTCEHECMTGLSGYFCKCPEGFKLHDNKRNCSDVDECQTQTCDHLCVNTRGSYVCLCKDGYEMVDGVCRDVDECKDSRCGHACLNSVGSFSCSCNEGFTLSNDGFSCVDIDECFSGRCRFDCINTFGSFLCTCPQGLHMDTDGLTCVPDETETTSPPSDDPQENVTEALTRATVELQHQSPHTDPPLPDLVNATRDADRLSNASLVTGFATVNSRVLICVLGSVIPLLLLIAVTLAIAIFRCSRSKKQAKKKATTDGYCWVSSGLDPRLEKLYESILTDDL